MKRYLVLWAVVGVGAPMFSALAGAFKEILELSESLSSGETISRDEIAILQPSRIENARFSKPFLIRMTDDPLRYSIFRDGMVILLLFWN